MPSLARPLGLLLVLLMLGSQSGANEPAVTPTGEVADCARSLPAQHFRLKIRPIFSHLDCFSQEVIIETPEPATVIVEGEGFFPIADLRTQRRSDGRLARTRFWILIVRTSPSSPISVRPVTEELQEEPAGESRDKERPEPSQGCGRCEKLTLAYDYDRETGYGAATSIISNDPQGKLPAIRTAEPGVYAYTGSGGNGPDGTTPITLLSLPETELKAWISVREIGANDDAEASRVSGLDEQCE